MDLNHSAPSFVYTWPLARNASSAASMAPLVFSSRSEYQLSNRTPNSSRSLRMSAIIASRAKITMESNSAAPSTRARVLDETVDVLVLVAGRRIGRRAARDFRRGPLQRIAAFRVQRARHGQDVFGAIAVRRERDGLAAQLEVTQIDADREDVDLPAGIVDVVLAIDRVPGGLEQVAERRAIRRAAAVAHVHGAGGIGRNEFDHHLAAGADVAAPVSRALFGHVLQRGEPRVLRQTEIDEAGAGDLGARDQRIRRQRGHQRLRQLARILARRLGDAHGDVALEVAVLRIARALDHHLGGIGRLRTKPREQVIAAPREAGAQARISRGEPVWNSIEAGAILTSLAEPV